MQDIYKNLQLLEDEQEEQDKDLILDMLDSLTHFYVEDEDESRRVPWYCMLDSVASDFGYSEKEMSDFAQDNGYIVFKISPIGSFEGGLAIADKDADFDMVKENVRKSVIDDFEEEKDIPEVKISFKDKKESLNESNEDVIEETDEYKIVKSIQHNFKTVNGIARKGKDKTIYQVYFRTQDFNPATNRWMNKGWANSTSEFDSIEDARAFIKKYGKELKEEYAKVPDEDLERLEKELDEKGFKIVSRRDGSWLNDKDIHYQIITKEGNQDKDSFNDYIDAIEDILDRFEEDTGSPCTFNMGLQNDGYISCGFDVRAVYYKPGEDVVYKPATKISFRDGKPADDYTKAQLKNIGDRLGMSDDEILNVMPIDKKNESLDDKIILSYDDLKITTWGKEHPATEVNPAYADEVEKIIDYEFEVDKDSVKEALANILADKNIIDSNITDETYKFIEEHFDEFVDRYENELKEYFRSKASKQASELDEELEEDIEKHDELNPVLFENSELKPEIKEAVQKIVDTFIDELKEDEINLTLKDIILVGSNVSYNYTKDSDLDIHLIVDSSALDCPKELVDKLYGAYRSIFNKNYDITIKGIPAEVYVELDEMGSAKSNGVYSLNNGWIKEPVQQDIPDLDRDAFNTLFDEWQDKYSQLLNKEDLTSEDVKNFIETIYDLRKSGIAEDGEYSLGNLVFKEFRNLGQLDDMKELRKDLKGKELSLEQLDNSTKDKYNEVEEKYMNKKVIREKKSNNAKRDMLKKYPNAYIPEIDSKTGLPILPDELFGDWEY